ncbi:phosphomevalonate kinase [Aerococcaceae bacterium DSM 111176]|nr:phosphomevalonate kinase [Aerococcaceae bacterium DSM 111176]
MNKATAQIPGKLYLAGEYAILTADQPALIMAVDRYITATVSHSNSPDQGTIESDQHVWEYRRKNGLLDFDQLVESDQHFWRYAHAAIALVEQYVKESNKNVTDYHLQITSDLIDVDGQKLGFGSSGAVTLAIILSLLRLYDLDPKSSIILYKLAAIAQTKLNATGSFGDLAASSFGGIVYYKSLNRTWLEEELSKNYSLTDLLNKKWPGLEIESLSEDLPIRLYFGWTGTPASTDHLVGYLKEQLPHNQSDYQNFVTEASRTVQDLYQALALGDSARVIELIDLYDSLLRALAGDYGLDIITPKLDFLIGSAHSLNMGAKSSGAGGGDCGIAIDSIDDPIDKQIHLFNLWLEGNVKPLELHLAPRLYKI